MAVRAKLLHNKTITSPSFLDSFEWLLNESRSWPFPLFSQKDSYDTNRSRSLKDHIEWFVVVVFGAVCLAVFIICKWSYSLQLITNTCQNSSSTEAAYGVVGKSFHVPTVNAENNNKLIVLGSSSSGGVILSSCTQPVGEIYIPSHISLLCRLSPSSL